jgi:hypothetical protein
MVDHHENPSIESETTYSTKCPPEITIELQHIYGYSERGALVGPAAREDRSLANIRAVDTPWHERVALRLRFSLGYLIFGCAVSCVSSHAGDHRQLL